MRELEATYAGQRGHQAVDRPELAEQGGAAGGGVSRGGARRTAGSAAAGLPQSVDGGGEAGVLARWRLELGERRRFGREPALRGLRHVCDPRLVREGLERLQLEEDAACLVGERAKQVDLVAGGPLGDQLRRRRDRRCRRRAGPGGVRREAGQLAEGGGQGAAFGAEPVRWADQLGQHTLQRAAREHESGMRRRGLDAAGETSEDREPDDGLSADDARLLPERHRDTGPEPPRGQRGEGEREVAGHQAAHERADRHADRRRRDQAGPPAPAADHAGDARRQCTGGGDRALDRLVDRDADRERDRHSEGRTQGGHRLQAAAVHGQRATDRHAHAGGRAHGSSSRGASLVSRTRSPSRSTRYAAGPGRSATTSCSSVPT